LQGKERSSISGSLFVGLDEIEAEPQVYGLSSQVLTGMGVSVSIDDCAKVLRQLHDILFRVWEGLDNFESFAKVLADLLDVLIAKSILASFPFNLKAMEKLLLISDELSLARFKSQKFSQDELWQIFLQQIQNEMISFSGSPLRGTQILGLLETRSLNFDNVIVLDLNEGVFPKLKLYEPLIPREVMLSLGLNRLEKEEEIQRYQFKRLIAGAKNVHLIYESNQEKEKSRFIEELLWQKQQQEKKLDVFNIPRLSFQMGLEEKYFKAAKTPGMMEYLKNQTYSASRLNTYLDCPLRFYFKYVLGLDEKDDLLDEPEAASIGTFVHELLDEAFRQFVSMKPNINPDFKKYFKKVMEKKFDEQIRKRMKSDAFLLWGIVCDRMEKFLDNEATRDISKIISLETEIEREMIIGNKAYKFKYSADRVDELADGSILIIDYKTGSSDIRPKNLGALKKMEFTRSGIKDDLKSFQLPIYYHFISKDFSDKKVNAALYSLRSMGMSEFIRSDEDNKEELMDICYKALEAVIAEIVNPDILFEADKQNARCDYCPFKSLCV
jgi:ATP-dependent helicase/nuclease subunit B